MAGSIDQARFKGMLESLQQTDQDIESIVIYSKFVVAYLLQQDGANPGWRKANVDGPVYLVRRRGTPRYQFLIKNQFSTNDLADDLHPDWELDCQKNYVFYKVEDPQKRIRGLWFHDDQERKRVEEALEQTLEEIRRQPAAQPPMEEQPMQQVPPPQPLSMPVPPTMGGRPTAGDMAGASGMGMPPPQDQIYAAQQFAIAKPDEEKITLTLPLLKAAWHAMAEDEGFMRALMQKLKDNQLRESG